MSEGTMTADSAAVEAVARAMYERDPLFVNGKRREWDDLPPSGQQWHRDDAATILPIIAREVAAARPLIAAECAKVAEDEAARCETERAARVGRNSDPEGVASHYLWCRGTARAIATAIKETIR